MAEVETLKLQIVEQKEKVKALKKEKASAKKIGKMTATIKTLENLPGRYRPKPILLMPGSTT